MRLLRSAFDHRRLKRLYSTLLNDLEQRGYIQQVTRREEFGDALEKQRQVVYAGIDPTASSLHIGHLIPLMTLLHFKLRGHDIIPLIGGATGLIGDPSGRKSERQILEDKHVQENVAKLAGGVKQFFTRAFSYAQSRNYVESPTQFTEPQIKSNLTWHKELTMIEFLQRVGVHARVNTMLNRESVRSRLESKQGLSFTEFTYQLLQAYDFYHLHRHHSCTIQIGGSDQWGNILAGLELISRIDPSSDNVLVFGFTTPLLTTASGEKFGKSAGNAIWLDSELTSVFDFYQYFLKVQDADVENYLKLFTLLPSSEISQALQAHMVSPEKRLAQRRLAAEVTELIHGRYGLEQAERITSVAFRSSSSSQRDAATLIEAFRHDPRFKICNLVELTTVPIMKLASKYGLVASTSAARQLIQAKGLYANDRVVAEIHSTLDSSNLVDGQLVILRAGKDKLIVLAAMSP